MSHAELFAFEQDFVASLRCIPMAVRFKLDRVGIKLTLRQWSRFTRADRQALLQAPCATDAEAAAWRDHLEDLVTARAAQQAGALAEPPCGSWRAPAPPEQVLRHAASLGLRPPTPAAWAGLPELRRFALVKLSRDNHDNVNFAPALREFGLL
ncbi:nitrate reductase associated protein [Phenylobacterium sp.]|jgi:hypothetical protein|uniref:nitrate reductase associated protein n=1 Tax=Phenylobacterium sp. TaxID=1871053 RepID=UPI002F9555A9